MLLGVTRGLYLYNNYNNVKKTHVNLYLLLLLSAALSILGQNLRAEQVVQSPSDTTLYQTSHELIVRIRADTDEAKLRTVSAQLGASAIHPVFSPHTPAGVHPRLRRNYLIQFSKRSIIQSTRELRKKYENYQWVEAVQMNSLNQFFAETESKVTPTDPDYAKQWNLRMLNLPKAWAIEQGAPSVIIAVVDSGLDMQHPDLRSQLWQNRGEIPDNGIDDDENGYVDDVKGWDFSDAPTMQGRGDWTERDNRPDDETGHGTHVAGIIAAEPNNGIGIAGVAWNCRLMTLRAGFVAGAGAFLQSDDVAAAIVYAADNGAQIINMSWGDPVNVFIVQDAVEYAYQRGCILVAAAGNSGEASSYYPASLKSVISVAALQQNGQLWGNSHFGATVDIAAPGDEILSTVPGGNYRTRSGTSMAAPHVTGVAALILSTNSTCPNTEILQLLTAGSLYPLDSLGGTGLLDAHIVLISSTGLIAQLDVKQGVAMQNNGAETPRLVNKIEIFGSAGGTRFVEYHLEFGKGETPDFWYPLGTSHKQPRFNALLYEWDVSDLAEGKYTLRLHVQPETGITVTDKVVVEVSRTPPAISKHESEGWFVQDRIENVIIWQTDVLTIGAIEIGAVDVLSVLQRNDLNTRIVRSDSVNTRHLIDVSDLGLPPGEYLYRLIAQNRAGIQTFDDNNGELYQITMRDDYIQQSYLTQVASLNRSLHAIKGADMNANGKIELITTKIEAVGWTPPHVFEMDTNGEYQKLFTLLEPMYPWETADTDMDGLFEILGNASAGTFLLEQAEPGKFPTERIWNVPELWGGKIAELDGDGTPEIFSRHTPTEAIAVYEAAGNNRYHNTAMLKNPTRGSNIIGTNFATGDFDGDGRTEILAGDTDADIFVYEAVGDNQYRQKWYGTLTEGIPQLFAAGDMDGDGRDEFAVGAKTWTADSDPALHHWRITLFSADTPQKNGHYRPAWTQRIRNANSGGNGITIADADNDGRNELCIAIPPNFYLIQHDGTDYVPIWHHSASSTLNPIVADLDSDGMNELLFSENQRLSVFNREPAQQSFLSAPWGITAKPIDETSVRIEWHASPNAQTHTIYRGCTAESLVLHAITKEELTKHFIDTGLKTGETYWYALASQNSYGHPSPKSKPVPVMPTAQPRLTLARYSPPNQLALQFDKPMESRAAHPGQYLLRKLDPADVINITFTPQSAILDKSRQRVILTFPASTLQLSNRYQIETLQLSDIHGAPIAEDAKMLTLTLGAQTLTDAIVYPNPTRCNQITFDKLPEGTRIGIYDLEGNRISVLTTKAIDQGRKVWHPINISSGIYIYILETDAARRIGKLAIIR